MGLLSRMLGKRDPERAQRWIEKGLHAAKSGRMEEALDAYQKATKADAESAIAHTNVGIALLDLYNKDVGTLDDTDATERLLAIESVLLRATELEDAQLPAHRALGHCAMAFTGGVFTYKGRSLISEVDKIGRTPHEKVEFPEVHDVDNDADWMHCRIRDEYFEIACSALRLEEGLQVFLDWVKNG